ncbi:MAG: YbaB/EbfC family nucleoid-associated protein [Hamadaea sp.]|nr:YbaB/EbfC family nucleoid-associated protein [Hamadaea sp.]NUR51581.1 YbaB/EbfC family nucleoid-associated protein [Hamadaea sp.]NUT08273.1 YbaB/EbfC family nucleoid-associated protein [Hamadaea sp.]
MRVSEEMLESMRAQARQLDDRLSQMSGALGDLQERVQAVEVTAESRDGLVRATVGSDGRLRDLVLDARIYHSADSARLARTIVETTDVAAREARERVKEICAPYVDAETLDDYASGDFDAAMRRFRQRMPFLAE